MFKLFVLAISIGVATPAIYNYCNFDLCKLTPYEHITCSATGDLAPSCSSDASVIELTDADKQKILDLHNKYRNKIANGDEPGFKSAAKMATMVGFRIKIDQNSNFFENFKKKIKFFKKFKIFSNF